MRSVFVLSRAEFGVQFADSFVLGGKLLRELVCPLLLLGKLLLRCALARLGVVPLLFRFFLGIFGVAQVPTSRNKFSAFVIQFSV